MSKSLRDKIIQTLIDTKKIKKEDIEDAMVHQKRRGITLEKAIIEKGFIKEKELLVLLVRELNIPFINLSKYRFDPALKEVIPERIARQYQIIPLSLLEETLTIAVSDPLNVFIVDDLKNITSKEIEIVMSTNDEILKVIDNFYGAKAETTVTDISKDIIVEDFEIISENGEDENLDSSLDESEKAPIIRMVNLIVREAIKQRASDIHMEPKMNCMKVRYRIDGILNEILDIPKENQNAIIVRIKIMSHLDITMSHAPQDGRFKLKMANKEVDFRVSMLPTTFGEKIVMRILDKGSLSVGLAGLGFTPKALAILEEATVKPFGMMLVTGPTGSGKSTTLYSLINKLNSVEKNVITVEDPVEYLIEGLTQIQARPEIGLTFAEGLRAMLRQSPDVVMVGEIRDGETADIAIKASLTGQLVFSTLHTNDSASALTRLIDMDIEPFLVASSVFLISAQRLCRKICPVCRTEIEVPKDLLNNLHYTPAPGVKFYKGKGCDKCRQLGYQGRMGITELLEVDDDIRLLLLKGKSSDDIKDFARKNKEMRTLFEDAMEKCVAGQTTLDEVLRITSSD
ncbi:MAG: Flp pilus assembly complex ATPase component TadA [Candidatus Omnitrophica bacterium]|nr:Flp pilus assembly complex ATPase component TadA [Candidatus Omnitrophota bacterium]